MAMAQPGDAADADAGASVREGEQPPQDYIAEIGHLATILRTNMARVLVGMDGAIELAVVSLLSEGHLLIEDVPGVGKTVLAHALARSLGGSFARIQGTPDLLPGDVTGVSFYSQARGTFEFRPGPIFANVVLADEINRATPRTQSALLEAMQERQVTVDGQTYPHEQPFMVLATQNPIELEGTYPLPEAELDRFLLRVHLGYPSERDEEAMLYRLQQTHPLEALQPVVSSHALVRALPAVRAVHVEPAVARYLLAIVRATRTHPMIALGASPRAALALFRASQARAAMAARAYVLPDDVKALAVPVLAHRLIQTADAELRERTNQDLIQEVVAQAPAPVEHVEHDEADGPVSG